MKHSEFDSELVWAFQYVDDRYLDIAEQEKAKWEKAGQKKAMQSKGHMWSHRAVMAACILCLILILALPAAAIAANWFGLRDLLLPSKPGENVGGSKNQTDITSGTAAGNAEESASDAQDQRSISLAGYQGSPEWQALAEWKEFLEGYDGDDAMYQATGDRLDASFARYSCYMVHSREMADKMDELARKYDLKLHTASYDLQAYPELLESCGDFLGQGQGYGGYMYEDGTFQMEGSLELITGTWDFRLLRSVRGTFHDSMMDIGNVTDYKEWHHDAACGVTVTLALGADKAFVLADLEDCFVTVSVFSIFQPTSAGADEGVTQADMEALADGINFAALSPAARPEPAGFGNSGVMGDESRNDSSVAGKNGNARRLYAATLRNLLYSRILPDGAVGDMPLSDNSKFAIYDVDSDGREELILCYDGGCTAAMRGYVIGCDEDSGEIYIQLEEWYDLTFLDNGNLKALDSHNQTNGEMWPYSLYRYLPEKDSYEMAGHAHAEDKKWSKNYPKRLISAAWEPCIM